MRRLLPLPYATFGGDVCIQPEHVCAVRCVVYKDTGEYGISVYLPYEILDSKRVQADDDEAMKRMRKAWDDVLDMLRIALESE